MENITTEMQEKIKSAIIETEPTYIPLASWDDCGGVIWQKINENIQNVIFLNLKNNIK